MNTIKQKKLYQIVGDNIRQARLKAGLNQTDLASRIDLSRTSIVNIEQGRQHPTLHLLWVISEILQIKIHDLIPQKIEGKTDVKIETTDKEDSVSDDSYQRVANFIESVQRIPQANE